MKCQIWLINNSQVITKYSEGKIESNVQSILWLWVQFGFLFSYICVRVYLHASLYVVCEVLSLLQWTWGNQHKGRKVCLAHCFKGFGLWSTVSLARKAEHRGGEGICTGAFLPNGSQKPNREKMLEIRHTLPVHAYSDPIPLRRLCSQINLIIAYSGFHQLPNCHQMWRPSTHRPSGDIRPNCNKWYLRKCNWRDKRQGLCFTIYPLTSGKVL